MEPSPEKIKFEKRWYNDFAGKIHKKKVIKSLKILILISAGMLTLAGSPASLDPILINSGATKTGLNGLYEAGNFPLCARISRFAQDRTQGVLLTYGY